MSVVENAQLDGAGAASQVDRDAGGRGMPVGVGQCLLDYPQE
jgi:hypothetical protein